MPIDIEGISRFHGYRCSSTVVIKAQDAEDSEEISEVGLDWRLRAKIGIQGEHASSSALEAAVQRGRGRRTFERDSRTRGSRIYSGVKPG